MKLSLDSKIYIAGIRGMVGSSIARALYSRGYQNIIGHASHQLDLTRQVDVEAFFDKEKPEYVFIAAAKVGGILANNNFPADFIYRNLAIQNNIIHSSYLSGVKKLQFLGSSCIYPKFAEQPIKEEYLLTGSLEKTNEAYAIAKIAGLKMCEYYRKQYGANFITAMPTNLYGPGDNYDATNSHVIAGLIRRFDDARNAGDKKITIWGTGEPFREFLFADDLADACIFLMEKYEDSQPINIGSGQEISIANLAKKIATVTGYSGELFFDKSKPDGTPRKLLDSTRLTEMGWSSKTSLDTGLRLTYKEYLSVMDKR